MFQRQPGLYLLLQMDLVMFKSHPDGTGFEGMKGSWKDETLHCERPGKAIGEGAESFAVDSPILKGSCKK